MGGFVGQLSNDITGAGGQTQQLGRYSGQEAALSPYVSAMAPQVSALAGTQAGYGNQILPTALSQYQAGASGQLTPSQQALVTQQLGEANTRTASEYANLGLGGSTMQTQDTNANALQSLAETANLEAQSEQLGLAGLGVGHQFLSSAESGYGQAGNLYGTAANILASAGGLTNEAGQLANTQQANFMKALSGAGNKSAG